MAMSKLKKYTASDTCLKTVLPQSLGSDNLHTLHHVGAGLLDGPLAEKGPDTSKTAPHKSQVALRQK